MSRERCQVLVSSILVVLGLAACEGGEGPSPEARRLALIVPQFEPSAISSMGFFLFSRAPEPLECGPLVANEVDPVTAYLPQLLSVEFLRTDADLIANGIPLDDLPLGTVVLFVEAYDGVGRRLYLGCQATEIAAQERATVELTLTEDPIFQ